MRMSVSNRSVIRRLIIAVAGLALVAFGSFFLYARLLNEHAERMLQTVYELSQQEQIPTLADIRERFGKQLNQLHGCTDSECGYTAVVSNRVLASIRMTPYTEIRSYFWVRNELVLITMVDYSTTDNHSYNVVAHVQIDLCKGCLTFATHPWDTSSPLDTNGLVEIGKGASAQNIRTALSLNTRCLTKFGGCESVADLLPTVWQQTANKRIACRIQNDRGFVAKPANWP